MIKDFFRIVIMIPSAINHDKFWRTFRLLKDLFGILVIIIVSVVNHVILDYENRNCTRKLVDQLVEKCSEKIDGNEMIYNDYENVCNSFIIYIVLFIIAFLIIIGISSAYFCFHWYLKKDNTVITNINLGTETVIY